jgi:hypothetical protein
MSYVSYHWTTDHTSAAEVEVQFHWFACSSYSQERSLTLIWLLGLALGLEIVRAEKGVGGRRKGGRDLQNVLNDLS